MNQKADSLKKTDTFNKPLARFMKETNHTNHQNLFERGDINIGTTEIKRKIREYQEKFGTNSTQMKQTNSLNTQIERSLR